MIRLGLGDRGRWLTIDYGRLLMIHAYTEKEKERDSEVGRFD